MDMLSLVEAARKSGNPENIPLAEMQVSDIQTAARSIGQEINILNASTIRDIDAAFATLAQMRADALLVATDAFVVLAGSACDSHAVLST